MKVLFVTGTLAEPLLRETLRSLPETVQAEVAVLGISVAALMTTDWVARHLETVAGADLVLLPGHTQGDPEAVRARHGVRTEKGPKDLRQIPEHFGRPAAADYGAYDVQILAEVNNAPGRPLADILARARAFADEGADIIDVGCTKGQPFPELRATVSALRAEGHRVSIDSFDAGEIRTAVAAGAELVLSVNGSNLELAQELAPAKVVVIPDFGKGLDSLEPSLERLEGWGVSFLVDPVLEPIGFGMAESLHRYHEARRRYPRAEMLMGIANLTELTEADSTGMTALLLGFCQELGIRHVLTTAEIPWARGAVREADIARRLMHYAVSKRSLPKHVDSRLVTTRDPRVSVYSEGQLRAMQAKIQDADYRIFSDGERLHVFSAERFVSGRDPDQIFAALDVEEATHAFYLGRELGKASLALQLGKSYRQEGPLSWGYLTAPEASEGAWPAGAGRRHTPRQQADRRRAAARRRKGR